MNIEVRCIIQGGVRLLDKMLEMSSSRKNIPEYVFLRSLGIIPEKRGIHSFHDLAEAFRQEEVDSADAERNYNREIPKTELNERDFTPDADPPIRML